MLEILRHSYALPLSDFERLGEFPNEAAVLIPITDSGEPSVILTKRAAHLSQHAGEVSFPGGKWEPGDQSLVVTALRETEEEIGLTQNNIQVLNVEPFALNRSFMKVTPYVALVNTEAPLIANPDELDAVFRVPLQYFFDDRRSRTDLYVLDGEEMWSPAYHYQGFEIWGLTSRILINFLNRVLNAGIAKESDAPVRMRSRPPREK